MNHVVLLAALIVIGLGVAGVVYGEADDSPGLQVIGALIVLGAAVFGVRTALRD